MQQDTIRKPHILAQVADATAAVEQLWLDCWLAAYAKGAAMIAPDWPVLQSRALLPILRSPTNAQTPIFPASAWPVMQPLDGVLAGVKVRGAAMVADYVPLSSPLLIWAQSHQGHQSIRIEQHANVPVTDCADNFDAFITRRSKRERQRIRRLIADSAAMDFSVVTDPAAIGDALEACLRLEQAGWKGRAKTAILDDSAHTQFYRDLGRRAAEQGLLRLALLHQNGRLIAFEYGLIWGDRLLALKTSFAEDCADQSPGHQLAVLHIRHCCADPAIAIYDVTGNGMTPSAHVMRYADRLEPLFRVTIYAPNMLGSMARKAADFRAILRSVKRRLRKAKG